MEIVDKNGGLLVTTELLSSIKINGIRVDAVERGSGSPLLFLHPGIGLDPKAPVLDRLAAKARLIAPTHPGFGGSEQPPVFDTVDDLAYFYLDLLDERDLKGRDAGGRLARRLDRRRNGGEMHRANRAAGARQRGRDQGERA
jgi:pimeloyl-ACP methyl ester carboxylesterase